MRKRSIATFAVGDPVVLLLVVGDGADVEFNDPLAHLVVGWVQL